jgi:sec-independent protein translocase protein TatB
MFDFAWSELALIGAVALVLIGPKDMPVAIKAVTTAIKKARKMAAEFQTHVDDMVRDADLHEVRDGIRQIRSLDIRGTIARAVDSDGSIRRTLMEDPIRTPPPVVTTPVEALPEHTIAAPDGTMPDVVTSEPANASDRAAMASDRAAASREPPAFIPPAESVAVEAAHHPALAPAFIPPEAAERGPMHGA